MFVADAYTQLKQGVKEKGRAAIGTMLKTESPRTSAKEFSGSPFGGKLIISDA
jgi:hypothetical protein